MSLNWLNPKMVGVFIGMGTLASGALISFVVYENFYVYKPLAASLKPLASGDALRFGFV